MTAMTPDTAGSALEPMTQPDRYRVLFIVPSHFFADYGCHVRILEEAQALTAMGHEICIVTYPGGRDVPSLQIHRPGVLRRTARVHVGSSRRKGVLDAVLGVQSLLLALRFQPHVIHAHLHEGALIGAILRCLLRIPVVFDYQGSLTSEMLDHGFLSKNSFWFQPIRAIERAINHAADAIIVSSENAARLLVEEDGCQPDRVSELPDCVDPHRFDPACDTVRQVWVARERCAMGIPDDRQIVVYLGLLAEYQGLTHLLHAARLVVQRRPRTHFFLMGYPGERRYADLAASLGIANHVTFPGRIAYESAPQYLALGEVAVSAKLARTEGNGKLLNYMAMALPVVAFDTAVTREILDDCGIYARPGEVEHLADQLCWALEHPTEAAALGRRGRRRVLAHYSWVQAAASITEQYRRLVTPNIGWQSAPVLPATGNVTSAPSDERRVAAI